MLISQSMEFKDKVLRASLIQPPQSFKRQDKPKWLFHSSLEATPNFQCLLLVWVRAPCYSSLEPSCLALGLPPGRTSRMCVK